MPHPDFADPDAGLAREPFPPFPWETGTPEEVREQARRLAPLMDLIDRDRARFDRFIRLRSHGVSDREARRMVGLGS